RRTRLASFFHLVIVFCYFFIFDERQQRFSKTLVLITAKRKGRTNEVWFVYKFR
ncbi:AAEL008334-PA, partial [Aedes aegypti]